jgi:hypothetical protein
MLGVNGMTASDFRRYRYITQWVTKHDKTESGAAQIQILGYCVRDTGTGNWATVFEHADKVVCEKVAEILNEGEKHGLQK